MNANDLKRRVEERKRANGMIDSPGCLVIFYPPNGSSEGKQYRPKKLGHDEKSLYVCLKNDMMLMLPKDRCVIIDPNGTKLTEQDKHPMFGGIEVGPEEDITSVLYDAYDNDWLEVPISIPPNDPETEDDTNE